MAECRNCRGKGYETEGDLDTPHSARTGSSYRCPKCNGSGSTCFPAETLIMTPKGEVPINLLNAGDLVVSYNATNCRYQYSKVLKVLEHNSPQPIQRVDFENGMNIETTINHSFLSGGKWKRVFELNLGDRIDCKSDNTKIINITPTGKLKPVYNLIVDDYFTFIADKVVVHSFSYFRSSRMILWMLKTALARLLKVKPLIDSVEN